METFIGGLGVFVEDHFLDISPMRYSRSTDPLLRNGKGNGETRGKQTSLDPQHLDIWSFSSTATIGATMHFHKETRNMSWQPELSELIRTLEMQYPELKI